MGMYTELHFNVELKKDTPKDIIDTLKYMVYGGTDEPTGDHEMFETARWQWMLRSDSYYFAADTHSTLRFDDIAERYYLCIRCNVKNYSGEIEKFVDWIMPYVDAFPGEFLGFKRYEEYDIPTLIYKGVDRYFRPELVPQSKYDTRM